MGLAISAFAQSPWSPSNPSPIANSPAIQWVRDYRAWQVDMSELRQMLGEAPRAEFWETTKPGIIWLPKPDGSQEAFQIVESPIMTPELEAQIPSKTYAVRGLDDRYASGRLDIGINGFHGYVTSPNGAFVIEPQWQGSQTDYASYWRKENLARKMNPVTCTVVEAVKNTTSRPVFLGEDGPGDNLKTYRLAMNATGEYTNFFGGVANAQAAIVTSVNRVQQVYERDLAVRFTIVRNNPYPDPAADPFSNNSGGTMLGQNQTVCDATPGNANYDIGHVFSTGGGGIAGLGVVGVTGQKARGVTGSFSPVGDAFDIDYVAHEMGHQYGANHSFNSVASSCGGGNRSAANAYEVGSGSTIMAYAGICGVEDLQPNSDDYFHLDSINDIYVFRPGNGGTQTATGNTTPTANAGPDLTIPPSTPLRLSGSGADANGDVLTYCWEQFDLGTSTSSPAQTSTGPLVRSRDPLPTGVRFVPQLTTVLNNASDNWEKLPTGPRNFTWRLTVRDNRAGGGGYAWDEAVYTVAGSPFSVTAPNTAVSWQGGSTQTVTWQNPGPAANVNIYLSTNGGASYGTGTATLVLANTPNDGSQTITVPNTPTTQARIIVEAAGNIYYDVSNVNFTITAGPLTPTITSLVPNSKAANSGAFTLTVNGTNFANNSVVRWNGSDRTTTFVSATQLTASISNADILNTGTRTVTVFTPGAGSSNSATFTVTAPPPTQVNVTNATILAGTNLGSALSTLTASDNVRFNIGGSRFQSIGNVEFTSTSPFAQLYELTGVVEFSATRPSMQVVVELRDFSGAGSWVPIASTLATASDQSFQVTFPQAQNPTRFVEPGTNLLRARVRFIPTAEVRGFDGWLDSIDRFYWLVTP
jgi:hypothetical protein